jgi:hypothetical protein
MPDALASISRCGRQSLWIEEDLDCTSVIYLTFLLIVLTISHPQLAISSLPSDGMALVPAGEFLMGNPAGSDGFPDEQPQRLVYTATFWIDLYEATNDTYARFVQATGHRAPAHSNPAFTLWEHNAPISGISTFANIIAAFYDHMGRDPKLTGDQIFNGALDNASGTAGLLEIAKAFTKLYSPPKRSVLFLAVTAEEKGLLGAKFYANNPLYPLERTLADINMDGVNQWGPANDLIVVGLGNSTLDDVITETARERGRTIKPDSEPEKGFFYRSDHFEFAKHGVPALYTDSGKDFIGKPQEYGMKKRDEYTANDYHKVSDEVKPDWDLSGAVEDLQLLFETGYKVVQADKWPEWKQGTEFKAKREAMLKTSGS